MKREHFIRIDLDLCHYYYSFGVPGFEICLEPCAAGFDVAIYAEDIVIEADAEPRPSDHLTAAHGIRTIATDFKSVIEPKRCTKTGDYTHIDALFGDRSDVDWNRALEIADELFEKYTKDREKLRELLARQPEVKGNDLISGEEITALRASAKTTTMKDALRLTMEGKFVLIVPMCLKTGFCVSFNVIENQPDRNPIEILSIGKCKSNKLPDPADADHIALAVLGKGYSPIVGLMSKQMLHYWKRRD